MGAPANFGFGERLKGASGRIQPRQGLQPNKVAGVPAAGQRIVATTSAATAAPLNDINEILDRVLVRQLEAGRPAPHQGEFGDFPEDVDDRPEPNDEPGRDPRLTNEGCHGQAECDGQEEPAACMGNGVEPPDREQAQYVRPGVDHERKAQGDVGEDGVWESADRPAARPAGSTGSPPGRRRPERPSPCRRNAMSPAARAGTTRSRRPIP